MRAFAFDVDGVFTDGSITVMPDNEFVRTYNSKDGFIIKALVKKGYPVAIISGGKGKSLFGRFELLGVKDIYTDCFDKLPALKSFMEKYGLSADEVVYMGDDVPDIPPMNYVGVPVCPSDAVPDVKKAARYVSALNGGQGCVRDIVEQVLRARRDWFDRELAREITSA